jgi:hypothetical protein
VVTATFGGRHAATLATWLGTPIIVPFLISLVLLPIYFPKYTIPAALAFYLLIAAAIDRLGKGPAGAVALHAVAGVMPHAAISYHRTATTAPWRESTTFLAEQARAGDVVLFDKDFSRTNAFAYYWKREDVVPLDEDAELPPSTTRVWVVVSLDPEDPGAVPARLGRLGYVRELGRHWDGDISDVDVLLFERRP